MTSQPGAAQIGAAQPGATDTATPPATPARPYPFNGGSFIIAAPAPVGGTHRRTRG